MTRVATERGLQQAHEDTTGTEWDCGDCRAVYERSMGRAQRELGELAEKNDGKWRL